MHPGDGSTLKLREEGIAERLLEASFVCRRLLHLTQVLGRQFATWVRWLELER